MRDLAGHPARVDGRLHGHLLDADLLAGVHVAEELVVDPVVTDVFQRRAAGGAGETLHVQVLLLDAHEDASAKKKIKPKRQFVVFFV